MLQNPQSLTSLVFRQKYFQDGNLMNTKIGYNPLLVWRSLLVGRDLLYVGLIWRIGNGQKTSIWKDFQIPLPFSNEIQSPMVVLDEQDTIYAQIQEDKSGWREDLVQGLFSMEETNIIKSIPLSCMDKEDQQVWNYSNNSQFTIRSAYIFTKISWLELKVASPL